MNALTDRPDAQPTRADTLDWQITEARHLPAGPSSQYIRRVDGVDLGDNDGLLIEQAIARDDEDTIDLIVWGGTWMFGINVDLDTDVEVAADDDHRYPAAPDRTGQVRIHGTWKSADDPAAAWTGGRNYPVG